MRARMWMATGVMLVCTVGCTRRTQTVSELVNVDAALPAWAALGIFAILVMELVEAWWARPGTTEGFKMRPWWFRWSFYYGITAALQGVSLDLSPYPRSYFEASDQLAKATAVQRLDLGTINVRHRLGDDPEVDYAPNAQLITRAMNELGDPTTIVHAADAYVDSLDAAPRAEHEIQESDGL